MNDGAMWISILQIAYDRGNRVVVRVNDGVGTVYEGKIKTRPIISSEYVVLDNNKFPPIAEYVALSEIISIAEHGKHTDHIGNM